MATQKVLKATAHWSKLVLESGLIIGSILLALAADAWYGRSQDREEERQILQGLEVEFRENLDELDNQILINRLLMASAEDLLDIAWGNSDWPGDQQVYGLVFSGAISWASFNAVSGQFNAYLSSGSATLIRNRQLRSMLAAWPNKIEDLVEEETRVIAFTDEQIAPFVAKYIPVSLAFNNAPEGAQAFFGTYDYNGPVADIHPLIMNREFQNLLVHRTAISRIMLRDKLALRVACEEILQHIRAELAA